MYALTHTENGIPPCLPLEISLINLCKSLHIDKQSDDERPNKAARSSGKTKDKKDISLKSSKRQKQADSKVPLNSES